MLGFFYFLSKTDIEIIQSCTLKTKFVQLFSGIWVLLSGFLSFIAGYTVIEILANSPIMGGLLALFFSIAIMIYLREIISLSEKKMVWLHIPFAVLLGIVISLPLEIFLLQNSIITHSDLQIMHGDLVTWAITLCGEKEFIFIKLGSVIMFLIPALVRLLYYNEYLLYIYSRMALNVQKINAATNIFLDEISMNAIDSLEKNYADLLLYSIEDMADTGDNAEDDNIIIPGVWTVPKVH